ncbi:iron-sulfur cluster assembly scaffold protein [Sandaracinobacter sp. RS1-74]|uniref:iron-sulfur cluster assembly scaffold protein n=1 Tax=Sandaracinobacteroides sayramensis TaxID=2913411 RepID=UPI001EDC64E0|nr:iron-sulfur cluster assembly scaffold protein [Sandaracinobacteroides sayramensis]MCG2841715.1 iron-sulfur cluster assembly scaffold protein [Sandaracinobacteroides sayramensis]
MDAPLYNADILRLAASIPHGERLRQAEGTADRTSPVCGSRVTVDVVLDRQGRIADLGQEVRACALGQASASILGRHALGETAESLGDAHAQLKQWLKGEGALPTPLAARFPELALFEAARAHPGRHPSILLAFEATAAAALMAGQLARQA